MLIGGARGIGAGIARRLAADGADVAFTYVSAPERAQETAAAIEAGGGNALAIRADSASADEIRQAVAQTVERFGRLDIVVVNAGILKMGDVSEVSVDDLDRMYRGFDLLRSLVKDRQAIVLPGHDPDVMRRHRPLDGDLAGRGIVVGSAGTGAVP